MAGKSVIRSSTHIAKSSVCSLQLCLWLSIKAKRHSPFFSARLVRTSVSMLVSRNMGPAGMQHKASLATRLCQRYLDEGWLATSAHAFICDLSQCAAPLCHTPTRGSCITQRLSCLLSTAFTVIPVKHSDMQNKDIDIAIGYI